MLGGALFFSRKLFTCDITAFSFFAQNTVEREPSPKFLKRHISIPMKNKYTNIHWATSNGRAKNGRIFFCVFCNRKTSLGGPDQKFWKCHNGIPIENNYTQLHWATNNRRGKHREFIFCLFFTKRPSWGGEWVQNYKNFIKAHPSGIHIPCFIRLQIIEGKKNLLCFCKKKTFGGRGWVQNFENIIMAYP